MTDGKVNQHLCPGLKLINNLMSQNNLTINVQPKNYRNRMTDKHTERWVDRYNRQTGVEVKMARKKEKSSRLEREREALRKKPMGPAA